MIILLIGLVLICWYAVMTTLRMRRLSFAVSGEGDRAGDDLQAASRLGVISALVAMVTMFALVRYLVAVPWWGSVIWIVAAVAALGAGWYGARAFVELPWLPRRSAARKIAGSVAELVLAAVVVFVFAAPFLLA